MHAPRLLSGYRAKVYVQDPSQAPAGVQLTRGPRGGMFFDSASVPARVKPAARPKPKATPKGRAAPKPKVEKPPKRKTGEPFGGPDDPNLPNRIKTESDLVRKQWTDSFNATLKSGGSEADAVAAANKVLPKRNAKPAAPPKPKPRAVGEAFQGSNDPNVPRRIQAESPAVRDKWVSTFNATLKRGSEADAIAAANATLPDRRQPRAPTREAQPVQRVPRGGKAVGDLTVDCDHEVGEKCAMCDMPAMPMMSAVFGGATSFDDVDRWQAAQKVSSDIDALSDTFEAITRNVMQNEMMSLSEKAAAIQQAAADLKKRLGSPVDDAEDLDEEADAAEGGKDHASPLARMAALVIGRKAAPTKTEGGINFRASDYADVADPQKPSTWKLRLAEGRSGNFTTGQVARAITAMQPGGFRGQKVQLGSDKASVVERIRAAMGKAKMPPPMMASMEKRLAAVKEIEWDESPAGSFSAFKDAAGDWRWLAVFTNKFADRDGEIFPESAHREYADYVDRTKDYPELRLWHVDGSRIGMSDMVAYDDRGFMLATGTFDAGRNSAAQALKEAGRLGVSHGFVYRPADRQDGICRRYRSFEISALPFEAAANQLTAFSAQEDSMLPTMKKDFLARVLGAEKATALDAQIGELAQKAASEGVSFKDFSEMLLDGVSPDPTPPAAATSPATTAPPAGDQGEKESVLSAVKEALGPVLASLTEIKGSLASHDEAIKALQVSEDEKLAALLLPRSLPGTKSVTNSEDSRVRKDSPWAKAAKEAGSEGDPASPDGIDPYYSRVLFGVPPAPVRTTPAD